MWRIHRLRRNKGVSAVIGVILLVSIVVTSIGMVLTIGLPYVEQIKVDSQLSSVYSQLNIVDDTLHDLIDKGEGATGKSQIAIESGNINVNPQNDKLIVVYSNTHNFTVSRLDDYDENFTLNMTTGNATSAKIYWYGTKTPYSRFSPSGVPPIVEEGPSGYFYGCGVYNFTDYTNNMANYTDHGELVPLPPSHVNYTGGNYTDEQYTNISRDNDLNNTWEGSNDSYVNIYYKFKIEEDPSEIAWINFTWVGYDDLMWGGNFSIYIWNISSTAWETLYQTGVSASQKQPFSFNITSPDFSANYIDNSHIIFGVSGAKGLSPVSRTITVTSPNGGETWVRGSTYPITWSSSNAGNNVKIELYKSGSFDSTVISSTANDGSYSWPIPSGQAAGIDYKIKITSIDYPTVYDYSNNDFTIGDISRSITVISPNGGETWVRGSTYPITWSSSNAGNNVKIELYKSGSFDSTVISSTANDGSYSWPIPSGQAAGIDYKIKITSIDYPTVYDYSNNDFRIIELGPPTTDVTCRVTCSGESCDYCDTGVNGCNGETSSGPTCDGTCDGTCDDTCPETCSGDTCTDTVCVTPTCGGIPTCAGTCPDYVTCGPVSPTCVDDTCEYTCEVSCGWVGGPCPTTEATVCEYTCDPYGGTCYATPCTDPTEDSTCVCCFPAGTKITMADGSYKNIEDVKINDMVLSYDVKNQKMVISRISKLIIKEREVYEINDGLLSPTDDHPLYVIKEDGRTGWAAINPSKSRVMYDDRDAMPLEVGDKLLASNGEWITINSIVFRSGVISTYTFIVDSQYHNYFANGLLVSNAGDCTDCLSPPANGYPDPGDFNDFLDDNSIMFFGNSLFGVMPTYVPGSSDSPLFYLKITKGIDETPIVWDINYLGINYDSFGNPDNNIDSSCCGTPNTDGSCCEIAVEDDIALTLYEYYVEVDVFYGANDNMRPWTNITDESPYTPQHNEEISYNDVTFNWLGDDDLTASEDLVYKYRLDPYETSWQPGQDYWTSNTSVTYTNLSRGNYGFHVRCMDKAHNIETIENAATNTRAFKIIVPQQTIPLPPVNQTNSPYTITTNSSLIDFVLIELYDNSSGTDVLFGNIWIFDFPAVEYVLPSSFGTYGFSVVNGAIVSSDVSTMYLKKKPIIYDREGTCMFHVIQMAMSESSLASGFSGSGSCQLSSRLVENRILDDAGISSMLQLQTYGKNQDAWIDYFTTFLNCVTTSDENTLIYTGPSEKLVLVHSIIEISLEAKG